MIKKFNEHKTESILNSIYSDLCKKELLSGIIDSSTNNYIWDVTTLAVNMDGIMIVCDLINNKKYRISINSKKISGESDTFKENIKAKIFTQLQRLSSEYDRFIRVIISYLTSGVMQTIEFTDEVLERVEEFEVIKNGRIDWISLNNLFDFYNVEFDEISFKKKIGYNEIH